MRLVIVVALILVVLALNAQCENSMLIGVRFSLSERGAVQWKTVRPLVAFDITKSNPNNVNRFRPFEAHHGYAGLVLCLFHSKAVRAVGLALVADDLVQHTLRVDTPLHMMSDKLGRFTLWRKIQF